MHVDVLVDVLVDALVDVLVFCWCAHERTRVCVPFRSVPCVAQVFDRLSTALSLPHTVARAKEAFAEMDPSGRGYITTADIRARMTAQCEVRRGVRTVWVRTVRSDCCLAHGSARIAASSAVCVHWVVL